MYSSDISMAVAAERRHELLSDAENWRRSACTRQARRALGRLAGRLRPTVSAAARTCPETGY
jgi:hypothetical protein